MARTLCGLRARRVIRVARGRRVVLAQGHQRHLSGREHAADEDERQDQPEVENSLAVHQLASLRTGSAGSVRNVRSHPGQATEHAPITFEARRRRDVPSLGPAGHTPDLMTDRQLIWSLAHVRSPIRDLAGVNPACR